MKAFKIHTINTFITGQLVLILLFYVITSNTALAQKKTSYTIAEINLFKNPTAEYFTNGFVIITYSCPPCPQGANCKPCMGDNIVISEYNKALDYNQLSSNELIVFTEHPNNFKVGKKYRFLIGAVKNQPLQKENHKFKLIEYYANIPINENDENK